MNPPSLPGWRFAWLAVLVFTPLPLQATPPALRQQVSLNGNWATGGAVPDYIGVTIGTTAKTYERTVAVPAGWTNKRIKIEFGAVNWSATVSVNGTRVGTHIGAWTPFAFDITSLVTPAQSFTLTVVVKGMKVAPTSLPEHVAGEERIVQWPIGYNVLDDSRSGIMDDVWLRAYGKVYIEDAFIQTAWRAPRRLTVDYTLKNANTTAQTVTITGSAALASGGAVEKSVAASVTLAAGERRVVSVSSDWPNPSLYWPNSPTLYHLTSSLTQGSTVLDTETRRFGFREIWIAGNQYVLNGVRLNLHGDWAEFGSAYWGESKTTEAALPASYAEVMSLNVNIVRWHKHPPAAYALELADETGLLITAESAMYGRDYLNLHTPAERATYMTNSVAWITPWVVATRNYASVVHWSACNEISYPPQGDFALADLRQWGAAIAALDPTRPIIYNGDSDGRFPGKTEETSDTTVDTHYPELFQHEPTGDLYAWANSGTRYRVRPDKPTSIGELLSESGAPPTDTRNRWWKGTWSRGLREGEYAGISPAIYRWAKDEMSTPAVANLRNSYAPVALFDRDYDALGIDPLFDDTALPSLAEAVTANRTLILYNDEFRDSSVTVTLQVKSGSTTYATGTKTYTLPLGDHTDIPCSFQVPRVAPTGGTGEIQVVLSTYKQSVLKFQETKRFKVTNVAGSGTTNSVVAFGNVAPALDLNGPTGGTGNEVTFFEQTPE